MSSQMFLNPLLQNPLKRSIHQNASRDELYTDTSAKLKCESSECNYSACISCYKQYCWVNKKLLYEVLKRN